MAEKKLRATTFVGRTSYPGGTPESEIPAADRALITNPTAFVEDQQEEEVVVQTAPVFGLKPGDVPAGQIDGNGDPVTTTDDAPAPAKKTPAKKAQPSAE